MADLFSEVDEALRQERMERFWKENSSAIVAFVVLSILATAAYSGYRSWNNGVKTQQTTQLLQAEREDDPAAALAELAPNLRPGLEVIADLNAAGNLMQNGKAEEAIAIYNKVANGEKSEPEFRDLAKLTLARLKAKEEPKEALSMLQPLWEGEGPWRYHARLEAALIYAHDLKDYAKAKEQLSVLKEADQIPESLAKKANALEILYTLKQDTQGDIAPAAGSEEEEKTAPEAKNAEKTNP
ncbi:MAG: tetratricopeptide repeat protein [Alphaproteobacteria bacterium]|nr:tetratricopeptide repeat protein [Alphaproteobacteria bacterium]